ncbi:hypothetical protein BGW41_007331 [Actinomortierella wolfii]|nr:hypothetical protein BGW41_007331 [Actinomortierella wolfii]
MFEPRHTARSSISSAGWTSPAPRARSASIGSVNSNDSVDLDAIIADGSDINDGEQLDLAAMDDDPEWSTKDPRKMTDRSAHGAESHSSNHASPSEPEEQQLEEEQAPESMMQSNYDSLEEDFQEHEEMTGEFEDQGDDLEQASDPSLSASPSHTSKVNRALSPNGHVSPDTKRSGRNPFDLETDFLEEHPVGGLVDVRQHQASRLRPVSQLQAPRQLARPSAAVAGTSTAGVSRLALPRAGSASTAKSGLVPPRASGLARPTAGRTQSAAAGASTPKSPASNVSRLAPPASLRPGRYATSAGTGSGSGIKAPGSTVASAGAGKANGTGIKAPVARSNTGLARPSAGATTKPASAKSSGISRPGVRAGSALPTPGTRSASSPSIPTPASGLKRPSMLQQPSTATTKPTAAAASPSRLRPAGNISSPSSARSTIPGPRSPVRSTSASHLARPMSMLVSPSPSHSSTSSMQSTLMPSSSGLIAPRQRPRSSTFQFAQRPITSLDGRRSAEPLSVHKEMYMEEHGYQPGEEEEDNYAILTPPQSPHSSRTAATNGGGGYRSLLPSPSSSGIPKPGASRIGSASKIGTISRLPMAGSGLTSPRAGTSRYS